jgi:ligand-binding sensor domain-containing protein/signal transduction histidine kinase
LVRFDGSSFTLIQFPVPDSPATGPVRGFASDASGNLWIRLDGPRLLLYHDGTFENADARYDLQGLIVTAFTSDDQHRIILTGLGDRTLRYESGQFQTILNPEDNPGIVISLAVTRDESIWLGTSDHGLYRARHSQILRVAEGLAEPKINCLFAAADGELWIGTDEGVYLLGVGATRVSSVPSLRRLRILAITQDVDGNLWIGTNHGIVRISALGAVSLDLLDRKANNEVRTIFQDADGDIWFGGPHGVEQLRNGMFRSFSAADGLTATGGGPLYIDPMGRIWFAPDSGGIFLIDNGRARRVAFPGLDREVVYSISGGGDAVWVGRERGGLTLLTESGASLSARTFTQSDGLVQNSIYSVHCGRDGSVWAGTVSSGLSRFNGGRFTTFSEADGLPSNAVNSIMESADGTIWVATPNGLASYANGHWKDYTASDGLPSPVVKAIYEDSTHQVWIGGARGLSYLSSGVIKVPGKMPDVLREQVAGIAEDLSGFLWVITSDHVIRVNRERLLSGSLLDTDLQIFGVEDGLAGSQGVDRNDTIVADRQGRIWLSLRSGLYMADPSMSEKIVASVGVRVESLSAGGRQFDIRTPSTIPPGTESITVNFGDTNLSAPKRIRFRYRLDGPSQRWSDIIASNQVVLSNLGPGSHIFQIEASSAVGLWNGPDTNIPFVIEPTFWQTWWFRVLCCIALLGILWAAYFLRLRKVTTLLHLKHQERLSEREDIARDLHDTFFQSVQSLFLRFHTASRQLPYENPTRQALEEVLDDSDRVMTEGRKMFLDVPGKESQEADFAEVIADHCKAFASAHPIEYRIEVDGQPRSLDPLVRSELEKIAREAIYNAFRHSKAKAIEVQLTYGNSEICLRVRDNGQGFDPARLQSNPGHSHLGLQNMRRRAEKLDGHFSLWSRSGSGTELEVTIGSDSAYRIDERRWRLLGSQRSG